MDRNQAKEFYPILQAFAEGKAIECRTKPSALSKSWQGMNDWTEIKEIGYWDNIEYRIKPEVKYRPFKNLKECLEEMQCHIPYGWIKTDNNVHRLITLLDENRTLIGHQETSWTYEKIFECFTFMDGKPFGVRY